MSGRTAKGSRLRPSSPHDLEAAARLVAAAAKHDHVPVVETMDSLAHALEHPAPLPCDAVLTVLELKGRLVGLQRLGAFRQPDGLGVYHHRGYVLPEARGQGIGSTLLAHAEHVLGKQAAKDGEPSTFGAWHYDREASATALLQRHGYRPHREMWEMVRPLDELPVAPPLPRGLEIRAVRPEHLRSIWTAWLEAAAEDEGAIDPAQADFDTWRSWPQWDSTLWVVAWAGSEVAGLVLNYRAPGPSDSRRGYTEYVAVRLPWRRRGLARALLVRSLQLHQQLGMAEAALEVNAGNVPAARLYRDLGYEVEQRIRVVRKALFTP